ncbi:hypothetical protein PO181_09865 [Leuconostoc suionicum]|uniref:hypothetical protein n=1 Tax=Leuconostoc suionicum TaxID=1511761 RepID=UPI00233F212E|nr:hypothetical protein [Leuconostoc suionicum]MDC2817282.1 hypothetical protein [Leuconostoc suionicum]
MVNKFGSLSLQGKSIGKLTFAGRNLVGANADVAVAMLNVNNTLNTENVTPQAGFDFSTAFGTPLKLIDAKIIAGTARSNQRSGTRVATKTGTLLPMSDVKTDTLSEEEYDAVFVSGKDKTVHGRVRSTDAFDSHDLVLFRVTPNYKTDNRGEVARDDYDEPIISNYQFNFIQQSKSGDVGNDDNIVRILVDPAESERLQAGLKPGDKLVPQGLKFAFAGNTATDWTVYADTLVPLEVKRPNKSINDSKKE